MVSVIVAQRRCITLMLCAIAVLTITPLGNEVEPEVYWKTPSCLKL